MSRHVGPSPGVRLVKRSFDDLGINIYDDFNSCAYSSTVSFFLCVRLWNKLLSTTGIHTGVVFAQCSLEFSHELIKVLSLLRTGMVKQVGQTLELVGLQLILFLSLPKFNHFLLQLMLVLLLSLFRLTS